MLIGCRGVGRDPAFDVKMFELSNIFLYKLCTRQSYEFFIRNLFVFTRILRVEFETLILRIYLYDVIFHAVSRTQQGVQREPSVKTLHSPLSAEF